MPLLMENFMMLPEVDLLSSAVAQQLKSEVTKY